MKPRTKLEHRVLGLSISTVLGITKNQKEWAYKACLEHKGFANKTSAFCLDCGESFSLDIIKRKRAVCPSCNTKIRIENSTKRTDKQHTFFAIAEIIQEFQVIRNFELISYHKKGTPVRYMLHEILQYWIQPNLKTTMVGRNHHTQGYCDSWTGDWSIRKESGYYYNTKYEVYPRFYYPESIFKSEYSKYGVNYQLKHLTFLDVVKIAPKNPKAETLLKAKQYGLLSQCVDYPSNINRNWATIKICLRNRYKVKDPSLYFDYLDLLKYFNKDVRNAFYVCPKNLKKEHDILVTKKKLILEKRSIEERKIKAIKNQKAYQNAKGVYFGLEFQEKNITIKFLSSVEAFIEESNDHKHCLFTNEYYKKEDSLCFSALVNGKPMETVEISKSKLQIIQSRGKHNQATDYHDAIIATVNKYIDHIGAIAKSHERSKQVAQRSKSKQRMCA